MSKVKPDNGPGNRGLTGEASHGGLLAGLQTTVVTSALGPRERLTQKPELNAPINDSAPAQSPKP
jgi:hypothetical protein